MKTQSRVPIVLGMAVACIVGLAESARAEDLVAKSFDTGTQEFSGGWDAPRFYDWDPSLDANTNSSSGSLRVEVDFTDNRNTTLQANLSVASYTTYDRVRLSVYLDPTNTPNASGHFGGIAVRLRGPTNWDWPGTSVSLGNITNTGWTHFEKPLPLDTIATSQGLNIHWTAGFFETRTIWIDNLIFVERAAPPAPPTLALSRSGPGLEIKTTGGPDYARKNVATSDAQAASISWLTSTGPVKYSMTVSEPVTPLNSPGHTANILLCAGTAGTANTSPDWNLPSGIFMEASLTAAGNYDITVRYKTNAPNSHGIRFTPEGLLIERTNTALTSLVGTWSLTLSNDTVWLNAPGGITGEARLPADALSWFGPGNNFWALFGAQPYTQNDRVFALSRVQVQGGSDFFANIDQDFLTTDAFTENLRALQEGAGGGVVFRPTNTTWRVSWGLPDPGLFLWSSPTLRSNDWTYTGLSPVSQGTQKTVFATNSPSASRYYQLRSTGPVAEPFLLESFETAVYSGPNPPYTAVTQSTAAGVTHGTYSMQVLFDNSQTWSWMGQNYGAEAYTNWHSRTKLVFDIRREAETFGWNLNLAVALGGDTGWNQSEVVAWTWLNAGESATQTITWDYSSIKATAPAPSATRVLQLNFMARGGSGGNVYIDNVRFE